MQVKVLFTFLFLSTFILSQLNGVTIDIEPNEMNQVSEIIQSFINNPNQVLQPQRGIFVRFFLPHLIKFSHSIYQMCAAVAVLVTANLLSKKWEPSFSSEISSEMIDIEYGCYRNRCWRTCDVEKNQKFTTGWCYIAINLEENYKNCDSFMECSPAWNCLEKCTEGASPI